MVRQEIRARGRIVKKLGDGLMLWFNDPCHAVECALALQDRFEQQSPQSDLPLWSRIGIHHGRPAQHGRDLVGHDVNLASRIVELASPGEVLASEATVQRIGTQLPHIAFEEVGPVVMKGIPSPVLLYRATRQQ
jgi:adenylate cyclase